MRGVEDDAFYFAYRRLSEKGEPLYRRYWGEADKPVTMASMWSEAEITHELKSGFWYISKSSLVKKFIAENL